jgi:hypothetical protein
VFSNGISPLRFLIEHREWVASLLGITPQEITSNLRDKGRTDEILDRLGRMVQLGDSSKQLQMFISRIDNNTSGV